MGSFICVKQHCAHCDYTYTWNNQPFVKDTPAANILMSAAILFSGSTPAKVLLMLKRLNMASIKERTFFDHQRKYLAPAIVSVWGENQSKLLSECVSKDPSQLVVMAGQTVLDILPSMGPMASLI